MYCNRKRKTNKNLHTDINHMHVCVSTTTYTELWDDISQFWRQRQLKCHSNSCFVNNVFCSSVSLGFYRFANGLHPDFLFFSIILIGEFNSLNWSQFSFENVWIYIEMLIFLTENRLLSPKLSSFGIDCVGSWFTDCSIMDQDMNNPIQEDKGYFYGVYLLCSQSENPKFRNRNYIGNITYAHSYQTNSLKHQQKY